MLKKVDVGGAFLQILGKCNIVNLLFKNGFIWYTEVIPEFSFHRLIYIMAINFMTWGTKARKRALF